MTEPQITLYHPPDVDKCAKAWAATCGPCALAAALKMPVAAVFEAVSSAVVAMPGDSQVGLAFEEPRRSFRGHMSIGQMVDAMASLERSWWSTARESPRDAVRDVDVPVLACLQWGGPWDRSRGAAVYRHWVVFRHGYVGETGPVFVYDWNAKHRVVTRTFDGVTEHVEGSRWSEREEVRAGGWLGLAHWERVLLPRLLPERGDGTWRIQWAGALRPVHEQERGSSADGADG
jgi:hypothetical protein